jgi:hypothetical protein
MMLFVSFFTLLVIGMLCLCFKSTRMLGVAGLTLLFLVFPLAFLLFFILGCIFYFNKKWRLRYYVQSKLPR